MLAFIKTNYQIGDSIELTCSEGVVSGEIEYVNDKYIVLRQPNGKICGIAATDIRTFTAPCPVPVIPGAMPATREPVCDTPQEADNVAEAAADGETQAPDTDAQTAGSTQAADQPAPALPGELKVVGHIDLDKLQRIDPKFGRRKYFRNGEDEAADKDTEPAASPADAPRTRRPFVPAKGRITFFNTEKRYGFIHDFESEKDVYFYIKDVVDNALYDQLYKGTKVVYSIDRNAQGLVARHLHLPIPADEVLMMAEDSLDAHHLQTAQGLVEHVLEADPDNKRAQELLEEIREAKPAPRAATAESATLPSQYNPCATYAQAKRAYLDKDYAQAETLYLKAIAADERPESCVKDLVTLYVSHYKQVQTEEEKQAARDKAVSFLESHRQLLPDNLTTKQFLALNYYLPIQDFESFLRTVDEIMTDPAVANTLSRRIFYIWQKGIALNKMGRTDEALALTEEGLQLVPRNRQLLNLRETMLHPETETPAAPNVAAEAQAGPAAPETASPAAEPAAPAPNPTTGEEKPDSWWDELKQPI